MAGKAKFSDQDLRDYLRIYEGEPGKVAKIAGLFKCSPAAVSLRIKKLDRKAAPLASKVTAVAEQSVWDVRTVLERAYGRLETLTAELEEDGLDSAPLRIQAAAEARKMAEAAVRTAEAWYRVEETKAFMDDVLATLAEVDPAVRDACLTRIRARRTIRSAFS